MATNQEEIKQSLHTQLFTTLVNHSALQVQSLILRHECLMYVLT
ncbi:hypothetical protein [Candidatus Tisiphia endosymbiont of Parasteatoda lunata]